MKPATRLAIKPLAALLAATCALSAQAQFSSGSTGADGALSPTVNTEVVLPPSGILNYSTVNIPAGVTVTFRKNTLNTPVVMLVQSDATIGGSIHVIGANASNSGAAGDGQLGDDGLPGAGGPGGFAGGRGAAEGVPNNAGAGLGPGGGGGGSASFTAQCGVTYVTAGAGGSHASRGQGLASHPCWRAVVTGDTYGSALLLPLIGGSGGGGAGGGPNFAGAGGGGGGGAILIAASGTLNVAGSILAYGGNGGNSAGPGGGAAGAGGAGGAIRLVATVLTGNGTLSAVPGQPGSQSVPDVNIASAPVPRAPEESDLRRLHSIEQRRPRPLRLLTRQVRYSFQMHLQSASQQLLAPPYPLIPPATRT